MLVAAHIDCGYFLIAELGDVREGGPSSSNLRFDFIGPTVPFQHNACTASVTLVLVDLEPFDVVRFP